MNNFTHANSGSNVYLAIALMWTSIRAIQATLVLGNKKIVHSILYSIVGIVIVGVIALSLNFFLNSGQNYPLPEGFKSYKNQYMELSALAYPADWTVSENRDKYQVVF